MATNATLSCDHCGAPISTTATWGVVTCTYCRVGRVDLGPAPAAARGPAPTPGPAPAKRDTHDVKSAGRSRDDILAVVRKQLRLADSLYYTPAIPKEKAAGARASYGALIPAGEEILVLHDATLLGGADDGFVFTEKRFGWKNLGEDPHAVPYTDIDAAAIAKGSDGSVMFMGVEIFGDTIGEKLDSRVVAALQSLVGSAPPTGGKAHREQPRPVADEDDEEDEEDNEEYEEDDDGEEDEGDFIETLTDLASEHMQQSNVVSYGEKLPRAARKALTEHDLLAEDDTAVVVVDISSSEDYSAIFVITDRGIHWSDDDQGIEFEWGDIDADSVQVDDGALVIGDETVEFEGASARQLRSISKYLRAVCNELVQDEDDE